MSKLPRFSKNLFSYLKTRKNNQLFSREWEHYKELFNV